MRCLLAGLVTPHSGGPGGPLERHYGRSARCSAGLDNLPKGSSGQSVTRPKGGGAKLSEPGLKPGNAGPGTEIAANGAPRGARILQKRMRQDGKTGCATRCSIPSGLSRGRKACPREGGEEDGVPGPTKNTGDGGLFASYPLPKAARDKQASTKVPHCAGHPFLAISARFPGRGEAPSKRPSSTLLCRRERFPACRMTET